MNTDALTAAYVQFRPRLVQTATRIVGPDNAEDVVQDAALRALRAAPRFRGDSSVYTWLTRITTNTAWEWLKRGCNRAVRERWVASGCVEAVTATPDESAILRETQIALDAALSTMPPAVRESLVERIENGTPAAAIAARLGRSPMAVKCNLNRARARVREYLHV